MRRVLYTIALPCCCSASPALAAGKAGLWTVTTTWQFALPLRAAGVLVALARQQGCCRRRATASPSSITCA